MNSATEMDMGGTEEHDGALLWEEWNASGSKLIRTAILKTDSSGAFSMHRECRRMSGAWRKLAAAFLPEGFPDSVTPDYMPFQIWDSLQGLSTYMRSMLSTQALLSAIGVGETTATVVGATFQGSNLDSKAKTWRLIADFMNDLGMLLDLVSPLYPASFVIILCLGSIARSFTGVASGATRAALTQHFALQQNAADISAKEGSQETMATMLGMLLGILLAHITEGHSRTMWSSFLLLTAFHMFANYQAVCCLCLTSLNEERASILLQMFMTDGQVLSPKEVSSMEHVLPNWISLQSWKKDRPFYARVKLGLKISSLRQRNLFKIFQLSTSHYGKGRYLLLHREGIVDIILHKCAGPADILQSYIHALVLASYMGNIHSASNSKNAESCSWMEKNYPIFISKLQASGWNTERLLVPSPDWRAHWMQKYS